MPDRWQHVNRLLLRALDVAAHERSEFLARACAGDEGLRREVESLLASHQHASQFLEQPMIEAAALIEQRCDDETKTVGLSDDLVGRIVSSYRIEARLGAGGMGEVYKAHDLKLDRPVALKLLPRHVTADAERLRRSRLEARAVSSLNHPHIVVVHDFGDDAGRPFMVTEYVEGQTLRERLGHGPIPIPELVDVAAQIAGALAAAHERGVLHRDIKPENVMRRPDGYVKVLDFGLAKLMPEDENVTMAHTETSAGVIMGTPKYMSPEQARGERVTFRSDQFSYGVLLYELATGRSPFQRTSAVETAAAVIADEAEPLASACPHMPPALRGIIERCLAKQADDRYESTRDLHTDLVAVQKRSALVSDTDNGRQRAIGATRESAAPTAGPSAGLLSRHRRRIVVIVGLAIVTGTAMYMWDRWQASTRPVIDSLAVLPLENLSGDKEQEYFTDGMTDALIAELAQIRGLRVISRTSIMQYKGARQALPDIGRALNVDAIVQGSIRRSGQRVAISIQLIRAADDAHIWTDTYDENVNDVLALHRKVARVIAQQVQAQIEPETVAALPQATRVDPAAYDAYLRGRFFWNQRTPASLQTAIQYFARALDHDPTYAAAYSGLADSHFYLGYVFGRVPPREAMPKARQAANSALKLDPNLAEGHTSAALVSMMYDWDRPVAEQSFKKAIKLNPNYSTAYHGYAVLLGTWGGRAEEAVATIRRGVEVDPLSLPLNQMAASVLLLAGRTEEAMAQFRRTLELNPDHVGTRTALAAYYESQGKDHDAYAELQRVWQLTGVGAELVKRYQEAYERGGLRAYHELALSRSIETWDGWHFSAWNIGARAASLGQTDIAFDWLDRAVEARSGMIVWLPTASDYDKLRNSPRYQAVLRRIAEPVQ